MAVAFFGSTVQNPREKQDWVYVATGGTISTSSGTIELVFDLAKFDTSTSEGKQRLLVAVDFLHDELIAALSRNATTLP